jgi:hypothetical protein
MQGSATGNGNSTDDRFDVFISHSHVDRVWVEQLARRLEDDEGFRVWLDRWVLVPGEQYVREMSRGLEQAQCCAVCIGAATPEGWFRLEIEKALNRQAQDQSFRVLAVVLPDADPDTVGDFLELNTRVDFNDPDEDYAFHLLRSGVRGVPQGRWPPAGDGGGGDIDVVEAARRKLRQINELSALLDRQVVIDYQRKVLDELI